MCKSDTLGPPFLQLNWCRIERCRTSVDCHRPKNACRLGQVSETHRHMILRPDCQTGCQICRCSTASASFRWGSSRSWEIRSRKLAHDIIFRLFIRNNFIFAKNKAYAVSQCVSIRFYFFLIMDISRMNRRHSWVAAYSMMTTDLKVAYEVLVTNPERWP